MAVYLGSNEVSLLVKNVIFSEVSYDTTETTDSNIIDILDDLGWTDCYEGDS